MTNYIIIKIYNIITFFYKFKKIFVKSIFSYLFLVIYIFLFLIFIIYTQNLINKF